MMSNVVIVVGIKKEGGMLLNLNHGHTYGDIQGIDIQLWNVKYRFHSSESESESVLSFRNMFKFQYVS